MGSHSDEEEFTLEFNSSQSFVLMPPQGVFPCHRKLLFAYLELDIHVAKDAFVFKGFIQIKQNRT